MRNTIAIFAATMWIGFSEFVRNQYLFVDQWVDHYHRLGLTFPMSPINGAMWGIWSLCFAVFIFILHRKFTVTETAAIGWFASFVMMWITLGNLAVLPFSILWFAIPLSMLESYIASLIINKISK